MNTDRDRKRYPSEHEARLDPLCQPLTLAEVLERTGRSRATIHRWVAEGRITRYELEHPRQVLYNLREVAETERDTRLGARAGRPGPRTPAPDPTPESDQVDTDS